MLGLLALLAVDALNAFPPLVLKAFIDRAAANTREWHPYLVLGAIYAALAIAQGACRYLWRMWLVTSSHRAVQTLREDYFAKLQRLPPAFYDRHPIGDLMALATNDVEAVRFALGPGLIVLADGIFLFLTLPPAMLWLSPKFTLLAMAPMVFIPFVVVRGQKLIHHRFEQVQEQFSRLSGFAQENIEGMRIVKAFVREWTRLERFDRLGREFVRLNIKLARAQSIFDPLFIIAVSLGLASLFLFGGRDVVSGAVSLGTFVAFLRYLDNLAWPMMAFGMAITHYQRGKSSLERIYGVFSEPEQRTDEAATTSRAPRPAPPKTLVTLEARNLTFTYAGTSKPALNNVSFRIEGGTRTALVGPIGSGKTTLVRLLSGLYEAPPGMLFWNGIDVGELSLRERRDLLSVVPQDAFLFSDTLEENVLLGLHGANHNPQSALSALEHAGLAEETGIWGLGAAIGERGLNLSGGQRARVTLARALARHCPLLVLDDSLSSIDAQTESRILDGLANLAANRPDQTLLMITHRFARLWKFDQVLVFDGGELAQHGKPTELSKKPGLYRQLLELQQMESALDAL